MFKFFRSYKRTIEALHPYRTAILQDTLFTVSGEDVDKAIKALFDRSGMVLGNHVVFKVAGFPMWFWYTDGELKVGVAIKIFE